MSEPALTVAEMTHRSLMAAGEAFAEVERLSPFADSIVQLARQARDPCVVAVVGQVKAGKSTFINALLGEKEDLAVVGTTETTATINYFRYGHPDPSHPIRCYRRDGSWEAVDHAFLKKLQGHEISALELAKDIAYLEYLLPNPYLERVTLVDTPGTGAVVEEHQERTAEYLRLSGELRQQHHEETQRLTVSSDAAIYLIGAVARTTDRDFLEAFHQAMQQNTSAMNTIGVIAKMDLLPDMITHRNTLTQKIISQLRKSLNTVLPVSAGLQRALTYLTENDNQFLKHLCYSLQRIPPKRLQKLLASDEFFLEYEFPDCPISAKTRRELRGDFVWSVFTTLAKLAADPELDEEAIIAQLEDLAGFQPLQRVLEQHFFQRSEFLHSYHLVLQAKEIMNEMRYQHFPALLQARRPYLSQTSSDEPQESQCFRTVDRQLSHLLHHLEEYNADFEALQKLEESLDVFSEEEYDELRRLFGFHGIATPNRLPKTDNSIDHVIHRQQQWRLLAMQEPFGIRRALADRATARLGLLLQELS